MSRRDGLPREWQREVFGLPATVPPTPYLTILVHFASPEDRRAFYEAIGQDIPLTKRCWYPRSPHGTVR